ncbi:alpha/beta fold hydrolase [Lonsdalea britannica]|uniref:alpha/beta fold hydrolase n=1 Tax=Lonsdalea britannica TaxID=1082704 RepID=UPI0026F0A9FC|nr:alpha/beta hydrolase [Lonsdalea britannica]
MHSLREQKVDTNGIQLNVALCGQGEPLLLLHGWPHTWRLWSEMMPQLAAAGKYTLAPDLRGLGASTRATEGYDLITQTEDLIGLLDALDIQQVLVVGIDLGAALAFMLALRYPHRVRRLAVSEGFIGNLPGAEALTAGGPPWWFGFHNVPGLAESVIAGQEEKYLDWFYQNGTWQKRGIPAQIRAEFMAAYRGENALACGFRHYRAFAQNASQLSAGLENSQITVPALAVVGGVVKEAIYHQLVPVAPHLQRVDIPDCAHLLPLEQARAFSDALIAFDTE